MTEIEDKIELEKRKKFFLFKRSLIFRCVFALFIFLSIVIIYFNILNLFKISFGLELSISACFLLSIVSDYLLTRFKYSLNKIGVLLVESIMTIEAFYIILNLEALLGLSK